MSKPTNRLMKWLLLVMKFEFESFLQENLSSNLFTGEEEIFAFDRTKSRLHEMQTEGYWKQWELTTVV